MDRMYTIADVIELTHLPREMIRHACACGELHASKIGRKWWMTEADVQEWLDCKRRETVTQTTGTTE